jgi:hypothetical protein
MHDDELSGRMTTLAADAERATRVASAPSIRARGGRRRLTVAGSLGLAAGLAALVGYSIAAGVVPGGRPSPSALASGAWPDPMSIPPGLKMPHEGEVGWQRLDDRSIASAFIPCRVLEPTAPDATVPGRTDARSMSGRDPNPDVRSATYTEQLFVYEDEEAAKAAMRGLVESAARCGWTPGIQLGIGLDPERLHSARSLREPADLEGPFGYGTALRRGNVLFVVFGEVDQSITDGTDDLAMNAIGEMLCASRQLCPARPAAEASWVPVTPRAG